MAATTALVPRVDTIALAHEDIARQPTCRASLQSPAPAMSQDVRSSSWWARSTAVAEDAGACWLNAAPVTAGQIAIAPLRNKRLSARIAITPERRRIFTGEMCHVRERGNVGGDPILCQRLPDTGPISGMSVCMSSDMWSNCVLVRVRYWSRSVPLVVRIDDPSEHPLVQRTAIGRDVLRGQCRRSLPSAIKRQRVLECDNDSLRWLARSSPRLDKGIDRLAQLHESAVVPAMTCGDKSATESAGIAHSLHRSRTEFSTIICFAVDEREHGMTGDEGTSALWGPAKKVSPCFGLPWTGARLAGVYRSVGFRLHRIDSRYDSRLDVPADTLSLFGRVRIRCSLARELWLCPATSQPAWSRSKLVPRCLPTVRRGEAPFSGFPSLERIRKITLSAISPNPDIPEVLSGISGQSLSCSCTSPVFSIRGV